MRRQADSRQVLAIGAPFADLPADRRAQIWDSARLPPSGSSGGRGELAGRMGQAWARWVGRHQAWALPRPGSGRPSAGRTALAPGPRPPPPAPPLLPRLPSETAKNLPCGAKTNFLPEETWGVRHFCPTVSPSFLVDRTMMRVNGIAVQDLSEPCEAFRKEHYRSMRRYGCKGISCHYTRQTDGTRPRPGRKEGKGWGAKLFRARNLISPVSGLSVPEIRFVTSCWVWGVPQPALFHWSQMTNFTILILGHLRGGRGYRQIIRTGAVSPYRALTACRRRSYPPAILGRRWEGGQKLFARANAYPL
jgi:hypothetical protein